MAVMALAMVPTADAAAAVRKGLAWIASKQVDEGGFVNGMPKASPDSTNTAGMAVQALNLDKTTYADQIAKGIGFLATQQNSDGGFNVGKNDGNGSDVRASAQVVGGVVGTSFGTLFDDVTGVATVTTDPPTSTTTTTTAATTTSSGPGSTTTTTTTSDVAPVVPQGGATPDSLAYTGVDVAPMVLAGLGFLLVGVLLVLVQRRRATR